MSMQNRFLALLGDGAGGASAPAELAIPRVITVHGAADASAKEAFDELERALTAREWLAAAIDDDKEAGALFGLTHTLWVATGEALLSFEEPDASGTPAPELAAIASAHGIDCATGVIPGVLSRLFAAGRIASSDMKALMHELSPVDSTEVALLDPLSIDPARIFDTTVAAYLLDSVRSDFDDAYLADVYLHTALPAAVGEEGAGADAPSLAARGVVVARAVVEPLMRALEEQGAAGVFRDIEMPLVGVLAAMERTGMYVEPDRLAALSTELGAQIDELAARIRELAGDETFNISSPMQLSHILFDVMGLPTKGAQEDASRLLLHERPCTGGACARPRDRAAHP